MNNIHAAVLNNNKHSMPSGIASNTTNGLCCYLIDVLRNSHSVEPLLRSLDAKRHRVQHHQAAVVLVLNAMPFNTTKQRMGVTCKQG
jgi:hypothetical protein